MSEKGMFYNQGEVDFSKIVPAYQEAFSGWPWFEVSKCVDTSLKQRVRRRFVQHCAEANMYRLRQYSVSACLRSRRTDRKVPKPGDYKTHKVVS